MSDVVTMTRAEAEEIAAALERAAARVRAKLATPKPAEPVKPRRVRPEVAAETREGTIDERVTKGGNIRYRARCYADTRPLVIGTYATREEAEAAIAAVRALEIQAAAVRLTGAEQRALLAGEPESNSATAVYFVRCGEWIKIGVATSVAARVRDLQVGNPLPLELVATMPGGYGAERRLHAQYAHLRSRGEWFRLEGALAERLRRLVP